MPPRGAVGQQQGNQLSVGDFSSRRALADRATGLSTPQRGGEGAVVHTGSGNHVERLPIEGMLAEVPRRLGSAGTQGYRIARAAKLRPQRQSCRLIWCPR